MGIFKSQFLLEVLSEQFGGNLARIKCLSKLISGVIQCRSVHLTHLASHQATIAKLILKKIAKPSAVYLLSMDRAN